MLPKSLMFTYHNDRIEIWDRYLTTIRHTFDLSVPGDIPIRSYYDDQRQLLWIFSATRLYRYHIDDDGIDITLTQQTVFVLPQSLNSGYHGKWADVCENTGDLFYLDGVSNTYVNKVLVDGSAVETRLYIPYSGGYWTHTSALSLCVDQISGDILIFNYHGWNSYTPTAANPIPICKVCDNDLTGYRYDVDFYRRSYDFYNYSTYHMQQWLWTDSWEGGRDICYHSFMKKILTFRVSNRDLSFFDIDDDMTFYGSIPITSLDLDDNGPLIFVGKLSGNIYGVSTTRFVCWDSELNLLYEHTWTDFTTAYIEFNPYSEEFYRYNTSDTKIYVYNKFGVNIVITDSMSTTPTYCRLLPGEEYVKTIQITTNNIILPNSMNPTSDTTPTVIFRVGVAPDGWTQQFRVLIDRDISKIENAEVDDAVTYERMADSWANGAYFTDWTWEYSDDWDENTNSYHTGTWQALGTGDSLQSGGSEPTNGVICNEAYSRYIRFTIPDGQKLEGLFTNDIWYFKIFSVVTA